MKKKGCAILLVLIAVFGFLGVANATLIDIGTATYLGNSYNLIYEDDKDLIWLDYTNPAAHWANQTSWASSLNTAGVLTYSLDPGYSVTWSGDWRLPTVPNPSNNSANQGYYPNKPAVATSEWGNLYYVELGNTYGLNKFVNEGPFENIVAGNYWTSSVYSGSNVWAFYLVYTTQGYQATNGATTYNDYAMAVRSGDVVYTDPGAGAPVPEPATMLLLGSGLIGLAGFGRRKLLKRA